MSVILEIDTDDLAVIDAALTLYIDTVADGTYGQSEYDNARAVRERVREVVPIGSKDASLKDDV